MLSVHAEFCRTQPRSPSHAAGRARSCSWIAVAWRRFGPHRPAAGDHNPNGARATSSRLPESVAARQLWLGQCISGHCPSIWLTAAMCVGNGPHVNSSGWGLGESALDTLLCASLRFARRGARPSRTEPTVARRGSGSQTASAADPLTIWHYPPYPWLSPSRLTSTDRLSRLSPGIRRRWPRAFRCCTSARTTTTAGCRTM